MRTNINSIIESLSSLPEEERIEGINLLMEGIQTIHPINQPVSYVKRVKQDKVVANDYNPNKVAPPEMKLLYRSIKEDGYTQPIVTFYDKEQDKYIIVDGFHRNRVGREYKDIQERIRGYLPVVVIDKDIKDRKASTIRHNRARGKHSVDGMTDIVVDLIERGRNDEQIMEELGMERDEVLRLKQNSGLGEIFKDRTFSMAWDV